MSTARRRKRLALPAEDKELVARASEARLKVIGTTDLNAAGTKKPAKLSGDSLVAPERERDTMRIRVVNRAGESVQPAQKDLQLANLVSAGSVYNVEDIDDESLLRLHKEAHDLFIKRRDPVKETKKKDDDGDGDDQPVEKAHLKPFGSPGGKDAWVPTLLKMMPEHSVYIEPYAGSASLFFAKEPVAKEILVDVNPDIIAMFKFLKEGSDKDFAWMRNQDWVGKRSTWDKLKKSKPPKSLRARAYRFKYVTMFSFRGAGSNFSDAAANRSSNAGRLFLKGLEKFRERLKNTTIIEGDALKVMKKFDGPDVFVYADPPWKVPTPESKGQVGWEEWDEASFVKAIQSLKAKTLVSYQGPLTLKRFKSREIHIQQGGFASKPQNVYFNYAMSKKALEQHDRLVKSVDAIKRGRTRGLSLVDLFPGAGAMSLAFKSEGAHPILGVEPDESRAKVYAANHGAVLTGDPWDFPAHDVSKKIGDVDVVTGAIPRDRVDLLKYAFDVVTNTKPKVFAIENVWAADGSVAWSRAAKAFERAGYGVATWALKASDFGAPHGRTHSFLVGVKGGRAPSAPRPNGKTVSAREAIAGLGRSSKKATVAVKPDAGPGDVVLERDRPARTMTAVGKVIHWTRKREMSIRELARLQDVPDDFTFPVGEAKAKAMIGDMVPVSLGRVVAARLLGAVNKSGADVDPGALVEAVDTVADAVWAEDVEDAGDAPVEKTMFGYPAGKKRIAKDLASVLPEHSVYVEPFVGSGAVFFAKEPVAKEVLADSNEDLIEALKIAQSLDERGLRKLEAMPWSGSKDLWKKLRDGKPSSAIAKLHRFLYVQQFSFGRFFGRAFNNHQAGVKVRTPDRVRANQERLKKAKLIAGDYEKIIRANDGKSTLFFLDPPYAGTNADIGEADFDERRFFKVLKSIKGKFVLTYGTKGELPRMLKKSGFHVRYFKQRKSLHNIRSARQGGTSTTLVQMVVTNFPIAQKAGTLTLTASPPSAEKTEKAAGPTLPELRRVHDQTIVPEMERRGLEHDTPIDEFANKEKASKRSAASLLIEAGPPVEWSGGVAAFLGKEGRDRVEALWEALSADDKKRATDAFGKRFDADDVVLDFEDRYPLAKRKGADVAAPELLVALKTALIEKAREMDIETGLGLELGRVGVDVDGADGGTLTVQVRRAKGIGAGAVEVLKSAVGEEAARAWVDLEKELAHTHNQGSLDIVEGDEGAGIFQTHETGLTAEQVQGAAAGWEPVNLHAGGRVHTDIRLMRDAGDCQSFEVFAEKGVPAVARGEMMAAIANFAVPEGDSLAVHPDWMRVGKDGARVFGPDHPVSDGGFSRFEVRDSFEWRAGVQEERFKEFEFSGARDPDINGRWVLEATPAGSGSVWLLSKPGEQRMKSTFFQLREVEKTLYCPILKRNEEQRLVTGVVLQPGVVDAQGDVISEEVIKDAAHRFVSAFNKPRGTKLGFMHNDFTRNFELVESYIAPADFEINGRSITKGSWVMTMKVLDDAVWKAVKEGRLKGFSIGGMARVRRL